MHTCVHINVCGWDSVRALKQHVYRNCENHPTGGNVPVQQAFVNVFQSRPYYSLDLIKYTDTANNEYKPNKNKTL